MKNDLFKGDHKINIPDNAKDYISSEKNNNNKLTLKVISSTRPISYSCVKC